MAQAMTPVIADLSHDKAGQGALPERQGAGPGQKAARNGRL